MVCISGGVKVEGAELSQGLGGGVKGEAGRSQGLAGGLVGVADELDEEVGGMYETVSEGAGVGITGD